MKTTMFRHGDCVLKINKDLKLSKEIEMMPCKILHKGNNHDHYFESTGVFIGDHEGKTYLDVKKDTKLSHGRGASSEHATKVLPKGIYTFEIQSEFDWVKNIKRQVID